MRFGIEWELLNILQRFLVVWFVCAKLTLKKTPLKTFVIFLDSVIILTKRREFCLMGLLINVQGLILYSYLNIPSDCEEERVKIIEMLKDLCLCSFFL